MRGKVAIFIITALLAGLAVSAFVRPLNVGERTVAIERGMGVFGVAGLLERTGVIRSRAPFVLYVILTGNAPRLQAGEYTFEGEYATWQIADLISNGFSLSREKTVVIPEGFSVEEIDDALEASGVGLVGAVASERPDLYVQEFPFLAGAETLEGFLFPDTYRFEAHSPSELVARRMLTNFSGRTRELRAEAEREGRGFYEVLILASILEKEVPPEDMPRASGVLQKRLRAGVALQADATLVYALGRPILSSDTRTLDSPYNTYRYAGLPPTPIANPGLAALEAALEPEENGFWYYLTRSDTGETVFSPTLEEHEAARAQYVR